MQYVTMSKSDDNNTHLNKKTSPMDVHPQRELTSQKDVYFNNVYSAIASAIAIAILGFSIGLWVAGVEHKNELLQKEIDFQKQMIIEKEKWEDRHKEEEKLDKIVKILNATDNSNN